MMHVVLAAAGDHMHGTIGKIIVALGLVIVALQVECGVRLFQAFPRSYTWTELMLSYQGGFARRGLLGEILFQTDGLLGTRITGTFIVTVLTVLDSMWLIWIAAQAGDLAGLLFIVSPACLLFPIYDFEAFGRKDGFILAAFAASTMLARTLSATPAFICITVLYAATSFVIESVLLYFPLAVALLCYLKGSSRPWQWRVAIWATTLAVIAALLELLRHTNSSSVQGGIVNSWRALYPDAFSLPLNAATYIGLAAGTGIAMVVSHQKFIVTTLGYLIGFLLSLIPLVVLILDRRMPALASRSLAEIVLATAFSMLTFVIAADWGRYIVLLMGHAFPFWLLITEPVSAEATRGSPPDHTRNFAYGSLTFLFCATWSLRHFAPGGTSPLLPGLLFRWTQ